ncbi:unnamed protein product, partial [Ixodes pacificus]
MPRRLGLVRPAFVLAKSGTPGGRRAGPEGQVPPLSAAPAARQPCQRSPAPGVGPGARAPVGGRLSPGPRGRARESGTTLPRTTDLRPPVLRPRVRDPHGATPATLPVPLPLVLLRHLRRLRNTSEDLLLS